MPGGGFSPEFNYDATKPAGSTFGYDADNWMRSNYMHEDNALGIEHYSPGDDPDASEDDYGRHHYISLKEHAVKPDLSGSTSRTALYTKAGGLYVELADGTECLLYNLTTKCGDIPTGEIILFEKDTAVVGWTLLTNVDDYVVYITKGLAAGGEEGGNNKGGGTWTQVVHQHAGPSHAHTISHTHTTDIWATDKSGAIITEGATPRNSLRGECGAAHRDWIAPTQAGDAIAHAGKRETSSEPNPGTTGTEGSGSTGNPLNEGSSWRMPGRNFTRQQRN